ncbi:MAG: hypothetical protein ABL933_10970 [Methyloglobulus sp.]|nr:hypothetical protein [Methyloglobulus sp.]
MLKSTIPHNYEPKDFIEKSEGLVFAVVQHGTERSEEKDKVLCFLRYLKQVSTNGDIWQKVNTDAANAYLAANHPEYLHYSSFLAAHLHAVDINQIVQHHQPRQRLQAILTSRQRDEVEQDLYDLCSLFQQQGMDLLQIGVTGSLLIGAQRDSSDIDLVFYDRTLFHKARSITAELILKDQLADLDDNDWQESFARRSCALSFAEYVRHERRKFNKGMINGRKFDLSLVNEPQQSKPITYHKQGTIVIQAKVIGDQYGFDYPAVFEIEHDAISRIVCFTATYIGQAFVGEMVEVSGLLEQSEDDSQRIVVGSSREAPGEYIKVIQCPN